MSRDVSAYLSLVVDEQARYVDALANATALLADHDGGLVAAAALQVRLAQQFVDAQRSILRMWADTDAKVARITETATLEAAVLGLRVDGLIDVGYDIDTGCEHDLRRLLERAWEVARLDGVGALERAQHASHHWLEVARLASTDGPLAGTVEETVVDASPSTSGADTPSDVPATAPRALPEPIAGALVGDGEATTLLEVLDRLAELLSDPVDDVPEVVQDADAVVTPAPSADVEGFWAGTTGPVAVGRRGRRLLGDAIAPMLALVVVLVIFLAAIG